MTFDICETEKSENKVNKYEVIIYDTILEVGIWQHILEVRFLKKPELDSML